MVHCEGCDLVKDGAADPKSEKFQRQYPQCPGHPTDSSCHGYFAGCNCNICEAQDARDMKVLNETSADAGNS
jgi:hypothetical protein